MFKKILLTIVMFLLLGIPLAVNAHVKWFSTVPPQKIPLEQILTPFFIIIALIVALLLALLSNWIHLIMKIKFVEKIDIKLGYCRKYSLRILKYGTAFAFIIQALSGAIFAPDFAIHHPWQLIILWLIIIGLLLPHHLSTKIAALLMFILYISVWIHVGWFYMLDYFFYIPIIFILFISNTWLQKWGFPFLFVGTGFSLCWVAVEKWVYPDMSMSIIESYSILTFGIPPIAFIILVAFVEFVIGYLWMIGVLNRVLAIVSTLIFALTVLLFGKEEIIGHVMVHIIFIVFIIEGECFQSPVKLQKTTVNQMAFVFTNFIFVLSTFILVYYRFA